MFVAAVEIAPAGIDELIDASRVTGLDIVWALVTVGAGVLLAGMAAWPGGCSRVSGTCPTTWSS